jgi:hypothetical protein
MWTKRLVQDQYRVRGVGLLEFGRHDVSYKVGEKVGKYGFYVIEN